MSPKLDSIQGWNAYYRTYFFFLLVVGRQAVPTYKVLGQKIVILTALLYGFQGNK